MDAYSQLKPTDSSCAPLRQYLANGTPGLRAYADKFGMGQRQLCRAVRESPGDYAELRLRLSALDSVGTKIDRMFERFLVLYPQGRPPRVYFLVGWGVSGGTTTRGHDPMILIGMELNRSLDRLTPTIAHEFVHTQQDYSWWGAPTAGPAWIRGSLLRQSIVEGSADFVAELVTGIPYRNAYGESHEGPLWREFKREMHGKDYRQWLWNGADTASLSGRPPDLGYFIGYRITKSFYDRAPNKAQALRAILSIRDFDAFLAASRYDGTLGGVAWLDPPSVDSGRTSNARTPVGGCYEGSLLRTPFDQGGQSAGWAMLDTASTDSRGSLHAVFPREIPGRWRVRAGWQYLGGQADSIYITWAGPGAGGTQLRLLVTQDGLEGEGHTYGDQPGNPDNDRGPRWPVIALRITCPALSQ